MMPFLTFFLLQILNLNLFSSDPVWVEYDQHKNGDYFALVISGTDNNAKFTKVELCTADKLDSIEIGPELYRGKTSSELYNLLIKPLEPYIKKKVQFKPIGKIHFINMAALVDDRGRRCCEKYSFRRVSFFNDDLEKEAIDYTQAKVYLFGGMVYDADPERMYQNCWWVYRQNYFGGEDGTNQSYSSMGAERMWYNSEQLSGHVQDFPGLDMSTMSIGTTESGTRAGYDQLQYSRGEIKFIYSLKHYNIQRFTGDTALEENFKLRSLWGGPIILHLSTHSFTLDASKSPFSKYFDEKQLSYMTSGLLFTGASHTLNGKKMPYGMNDGLLYSEEIARFNLSRMDLVVLSACGTALGTVTNDGVWGIQSAFKEAGAKTIVSTLWSINDQAAAEFMKVFYTYMSDGYSKYEAFEMARNYMIRSNDFNDPLYWAPFIMLD